MKRSAGSPDSQSCYSYEL